MEITEYDRKQNYTSHEWPNHETGTEGLLWGKLLSLSTVVLPTSYSVIVGTYQIVETNIHKSNWFNFSCLPVDI